MSYCRFSSDNWRSDVYCYENKDGYVTHVARSRLTDVIPPLLPFDDPNWLTSYQTRGKAIECSSRYVIGLEYDGETFCDDSLSALLERLQMLRAAGYHVPESALEEIRDEMRGGRA